MLRLRQTLKHFLWQILGPIGLLSGFEDALLRTQAVFSVNHKRELERRAKRLVFYSHLINPGDLCFDIGANFGNRTEPFLCSGADVIAVEPQSYPLRYLYLKYGKNKRVTIVPIGVDEVEGEKKLYIASASGASSISEELVNIRSQKQTKLFYDGRVELIKLTTLDQLISQYGVPDFIKLDVEGFEYQAVKGLSHPVKQIVFEYTPERIEPSLQCIRHLQRLGDYEFNYSIGESVVFSLQEWIDADAMIDLAANHISPSTTETSFGDIYARLR